MIIRDLEHYEIGSQVSHKEGVRGGFFGLLSLSIDTINIGSFTLVQGEIDVINEQGNPATGSPTITGFSFSLNSLVSSQPPA